MAQPVKEVRRSTVRPNNRFLASFHSYLTDLVQAIMHLLRNKVAFWWLRTEAPFPFGILVQLYNSPSPPLWARDSSYVVEQEAAFLSLIFLEFYGPCEIQLKATKLSCFGFAETLGPKSPKRGTSRIYSSRVTRFPINFAILILVLME